MITIEIDETAQKELADYFKKVDAPARAYVARQLIIYALSVAPNAHLSPFVSFTQQGKQQKQEQTPDPAFDYEPATTKKFVPAPRGEPKERQVVQLTEQERLKALEEKLGKY